eukprot:2112308-Rhodomonas_salina.1
MHAKAPCDTRQPRSRHGPRPLLSCRAPREARPERARPAGTPRTMHARAPSLRRPGTRGPGQPAPQPLGASRTG